MLSRLLIVLLSCAAGTAAADYPGREWAPHSRVGWSEPLLKAAQEYMTDQKTQSVMIVQSGQVVLQWGDVTRKIEVRSIRKSFLNAMYGIHVAEGHIDLARTLDELGIDDNAPSLTPVEKQATILICFDQGQGSTILSCGRRREWLQSVHLGIHNRPVRTGTTTTGISMFWELFSRS